MTVLTRRGPVLLLAAVLVAAPLTLGAQVASAATGPTAVDDTATLPSGGFAVLAGAKNDRPGSAAIQPGLTVFPTEGQPAGSTISDAGRTIQVPKHGTFQLAGDGTVGFTSWARLTGTASVRYRITDAAGATDDGLLTAVVTGGGTGDDALTEFGTELAVTDLLANDTPGRNADQTFGTLDRTSVRFQPDQYAATITDDGRTATVGTVGVATLDGQGLLTWRANPSSSPYGLGAGLAYTARDTTRAADGSIEHHAYDSTVNVGGYPNSNPERVRTTDDRASTPYNASVTLPGGVNDHPYRAGATIVPRWSTFDVGAVAPDASLSSDKRKIRYPGRGTWTINPDGSVLYVPRRGFVGRDAVNLRVVDDSHEDGYEELVVVVQPGPKGTPDTATTPRGVAVTAAVLANDVSGRDADGTAGSLDQTYVRFPTDGQPSGAVVSAYARTLTVPGQGVYVADRATGKVTFRPAAGLVGRASPITCSARDTVTRTDGRVVHTPFTSTLTVTVG
ncbi:Ig-like domain-containing protein [Microlunatus flavus]|uniref:CshA-type fibril repeat-containing protein n=1 Tax=Microlunatus flavus TaxID=1036181 RepID=A0A1H9LV28_9ACTN|nr:Ig-like domain-containing protein [Microlunatus flavus]SER15109.1 CshA-type fibril repeat-containing protein [Microlunatus flavus]